MGGRKKGTPNKRRVLKVEDSLLKADIEDPVARILDLLPDLRPYEQVRVWLDLISYIQPKPRDEAEEGQAMPTLDESAVAALVDLARKK